jgi:hypothetical protein
MPMLHLWGRGMRIAYCLLNCGLMPLYFKQEEKQ